MSGYRRVTALLRAIGWHVGKDRVQRIWRREALKVPGRHRPRGRLWLNDGSCVRLRPLYRNHVWSFDFVQAQTHDGRSLSILTLIDEHSRTCLALKVGRRINSVGVIEALAEADLTGWLWTELIERISKAHGRVPGTRPVDLGHPQFEGFETIGISTTA